MSRDINKLIEPFQTGIRDLIKKANDAGLNAFVTDTTRTIEEQRELVRKGYSYTMNSKHLTGEAADIAFLVDEVLSYDRNLYKRLYTIAKDIPFVIWTYNDLGWNWDYPHFQYDKNKEGGTINEMAEVTQLKEEVRKLNTEIGVITPERDAYKDQRDEEVKQHKETINRLEDTHTKWQVEIERANKAEEKLDKINDIL